MEGFQLVRLLIAVIWLLLVVYLGSLSGRWWVQGRRGDALISGVMVNVFFLSLLLQDTTPGKGDVLVESVTTALAIVFFLLSFGTGVEIGMRLQRRSLRLTN